LLLVVVAAPVLPAHQLDEYLQTTRLDLSRERIVVELQLTPGAAIANDVLAVIDRDGNGMVAPDELDAYTQRILRDVSLRVDDRRVSLAVRRVTFPEWDAVRDGMGTIRIEAVGTVAIGQPGVHRIVYENVHWPGAGVYLVNALKPSTGDVVIGAQRRDRRQHQLDLDVAVRSSAAPALWAVVGLALLSGLLVVRARASGFMQPH
jgi:hypothetical protein